MLAQIAAALALLGSIDACTIVAVSKEAAFDKTPLIAHTDDAGGGAADLRLVHVPAMDHPHGSERAVYDLNSGYPRLTTLQRGPEYEPKPGENLTEPLGYIPQVAHTYAYFDQDYGMMNEVQLSIAESTCAARTVGWPSDVPYGYNLFGIAELSKLALERCDSARCAIQTMGDAAVEYGFYSEDSGNPLFPGYSDSAEALAISDKYGETWAFHVLTGPHNASAVWAAQRVPPGHVAAIANGFIIRQLNLTDNDNFMASSNVESFAREQGWWDPASGPFDFTAAYNYHTNDAVGPLYVGRRVWRVLDWFAPSLKLDSTLGQDSLPTYPFSVPVDKPVTVESLMELLKDHYEGTPYDMTKGLAAGPFGSPVRVFDFVNNWSLLRFNLINAEVRQEAKLWQERAFAQQATYRQQQLNVTALEAVNNAFADEVFQAWWAFAWRLVAKYSDGYITEGELPSQQRLPGYPTWWLRQTAFSQWPGDTYHPPKAGKPTTALRKLPSSDWSNVVLAQGFLVLLVGVAIGMWIQRFGRRAEYHRLE
ncbi:unnamed protein product [Aphanomyces euteiches]